MASSKQLFMFIFLFGLFLLINLASLSDARQLKDPIKEKGSSGNENEGGEEKRVFSKIHTRLNEGEKFDLPLVPQIPLVATIPQLPIPPTIPQIPELPLPPPTIPLPPIPPTIPQISLPPPTIPHLPHPPPFGMPGIPSVPTIPGIPHLPALNIPGFPFSTPPPV